MNASLRGTPVDFYSGRGAGGGTINKHEAELVHFLGPPDVVTRSTMFSYATKVTAEMRMKDMEEKTCNIVM